jgi:uncharacterized protein (TIGR04255 family)
MPFPEPERVIYDKNPLHEVVCQLRFPTILRISSEEPAEFQEKIRAHYPLYAKRQALPGGEAAALFEKLSVPLPAAAAAHAFTTEDAGLEIVLTPGFLAVKDMKYVRWERLFEAIEEAKTALESVYSPSFYERIGLRYINLIYKEDLGIDDPDWSDLLSPGVAGVLSDPRVGPDVTETNSEVVLRVDDAGSDAYVKVRYGFARRSDRPESYGFLIDSDFFTQSKERGHNVADRLASFNRNARRLFRWATTEKLHSALSPQSADR